MSITLSQLWFGPRNFPEAAKIFRITDKLESKFDTTLSEFWSLFSPDQEVVGTGGKFCRLHGSRRIPLIKASKVDLLKSVGSKTSASTSLIPADLRTCLEKPSRDLTQQVGTDNGMGTIDSLPKSAVHAEQGEYPHLLLKATQPGMIRWSQVNYEEPKWRKIADALSVTSFAVLKRAKGQVHFLDTKL